MLVLPVSVIASKIVNDINKELKINKENFKMMK